MMYVYDYRLIFSFPRDNDMSFLKFHLCSFIAHICPVIYFLYNVDINYNEYVNVNVGIYTMLFKLLWCFFSCKDFNIAKLYSKDHCYLSRLALKFGLIVHYFTGLTFYMLKNNYYNIKYIK